ncbi:MAG: GatB/YqeY domain-containing protein [Chitinophagales bacterium]|nr:GatB/YqeY domain-containing protein [Chitinophagaceae bacterium]MBP9881918.1 GatB/YqeY domain-containing protein [Chitinophagales bacterium]
MTLEEKINADLKQAMLNKDEAGLRAIRAIKSAILLSKTEKDAKELDNDLEIKLLQKLVKQRKDALEIFEKERRDDLAQKEREEILVIEKYLPAQMSVEELKAILKIIIAETGAKTPQDMGKVMGIASKQLAGKSDGKTISAVVKELLSTV